MKKIGIIGAMDVEVATLKEMMEREKTVTRARMDFVEGTLDGCPVVVVQSGVGKVNAAVCTQILADEFGVDAIINTGIAGSLRAEINIGDIVLSTDTVQHDVDATRWGYPQGQIPQMEVFSFAADSELRKTLKEVGEKLTPDINIFEGRIVSGDQFIGDRAVKEKISTTFAGYCTEMEGAAIAQVAYLNQIPFVIVRAVSDKADDSAETTMEIFEKENAERSVRLVRGFLQEIRQREQEVKA